jgi:hypothetical protein
MHVESGWLNLKNKKLLMAEKIANAWQFDDDTENLFPERPLLEDMEDSASGARDIQPQKLLRDRQYGSQPLIVMPEYKGDFLDTLRPPSQNKCCYCVFLDFCSPKTC